MPSCHIYALDLVAIHSPLRLRQRKLTERNFITNGEEVAQSGTTLRDIIRLDTGGNRHDHSTLKGEL